MLTFALVAPFVGYEALSTRIRIFLKTEFFFSGYSFCPHVNCVFGNRNRSSLKTVSRRYIFFNRIFLEPCEQRGKRRFSKTMTSNVVDRQLKRFENSTCERGLFQKTSVFKNIRMRVDRQKRFENATCERGFFRKREKKNLRFQKSPDTCGRGLSFTQPAAVPYYHSCHPACHSTASANLHYTEWYRHTNCSDTQCCSRVDRSRFSVSRQNNLSNSDLSLSKALRVTFETAQKM